MYEIALWSPFGASQFITHTVYNSWITEWATKLGIQAFWIVILAALVYILFAKAKKKVAVNGG